MNHSELGRDNSNLYLNPSGGAIPKQKNTKSNNNRRVINDCKLINVIYYNRNYTLIIDYLLLFQYQNKETLIHRAIE